MTDIGSIFTAVMGYFGDICQAFLDNPVLELGLAMLVIGFAVGILSRLIRV